MSKAKNNFFQKDRERDRLIGPGSLTGLKKTYHQEAGLNPNTGKLWDKKIKGEKSLLSSDPMTKDRIKSAVNLVDKNARTILDVGVGYGFLENLLLKNNRELGLSGIDISKTAIKEAKKNFHGEFKVGIAQRIPFRKKFDVVVALEILEHILSSEIFKVYREIKRVLKKNGQLLVSVPVFEKYTLSYNPNRHLRQYTPRLVKAELELAGFKVEKEKELFAFKKNYFLKNILRKILPNRWKPNVILLSCRKKP